MTPEKYSNLDTFQDRNIVRGNKSNVNRDSDEKTRRNSEKEVLYEIEGNDGKKLFTNDPEFSKHFYIVKKKGSVSVSPNKNRSESPNRSKQDFDFDMDSKEFNKKIHNSSWMRNRLISKAMDTNSVSVVSNRESVEKARKRNNESHIKFEDRSQSNDRYSTEYRDQYCHLNKGKNSKEKDCISVSVSKSRDNKYQINI